MNENEQPFDELNLEDILREFGEHSDSEPTRDEEETARRGIPGLEQLFALAPDEKDASGPADEVLTLEELEAVSITRSDADSAVDDDMPADAIEIPEQADDSAMDTEEVSDLPETQADDVPPSPAPADTVRLDDLSQIPDAEGAPSVPAEKLEDEEFDATEDTLPPPIPFRPHSRLQEMKRQLIAGPEKRYYELTEIGVGKLQIAIVLCLSLVLSLVAGLLAY